MNSDHLDEDSDHSDCVMYLKKLEIHGFKSFASKVALLFEPGITSVVGPNGSGKSNIADSLRWAFGEQSMKLLRSRKAEDVIFVGSEGKARLGSCEVNVYFDNVDHKMPLAYEEVVIGRRLSRSGDSEYLINGTQVRLLDIQELLLKSGFGNTSYCVIGQGMIDQLVLGGPVAIKEMIEEAAGIKPYYFKRARTLRRLERTEANLVQVNALVSEIEPRLRSLKRQAKKLERRAEIEQELKAALILHFGQLLKSLERQTTDQKNKEAVFDKQLLDLTEEIKSLLGDIENEEKVFQGGGEGYKKLQVALADLYREKQKCLEDQVKLQGQLQASRLQGPGVPRVNWASLKAKFKNAYDRLKNLLRDFGNFENNFPALKQEVGETEKLLSVVWLELQEDESNKRKEEEGKLMEEQIKKAELAVGVLSQRIAETEQEQREAAEAEALRKSQLFVKDRLLRNKQETLVKTRDAKNQLLVELARLDARKEGIEDEAKNELGADFLARVFEVKTQMAPAGLTEKIANLKRQLMDIGGVDDMVQTEYQETEERYQYLTSQSDDLEKGMKDLRTVVLELDEIIKKQFHEAFGKISEKFSDYFRILFSGGKATMSLVKTKSFPSPYPLPSGERDEGRGPEEEGADEERQIKEEIAGIEIRATPPGKRLAGLSALSGGERALTSIALLCAILATYPSPFVVLDEVDAALDEANSIRFGKILGTLSHRTQFITITHNRETMRQSHTLYGVTMREDGVSKVLSLKLQEAAAYGSKN